MAVLELKIVTENGDVIVRSKADNFVDLVYSKVYEPGMEILLHSDTYPVFLNIQLDDGIQAGIVYLTSDFRYPIPFGEKCANLSPKAFGGNLHYLHAGVLPKEQLPSVRNLACNPYDISVEGNAVSAWPHAYANIETRNETVFAARNAIDGVKANSFHGQWPYTSWGINRRPDAEFHLEFGRVVEVNYIVIYTRADFPHDSWWIEGKITFSNGDTICFPLEKSCYGQRIDFTSKRITGLTLHSLVKADDPSPFPALTQIEVYGKEIEE